MTTQDDAAPESEGYHADYERARAEGRFVVARCASCGHRFWHPRSHCPVCLSERVELVEPEWPATVYSYTVNHRPKKADEEGATTTVGYVDVDSGVLVLGALELPAGADVIGARVRPQSRKDEEGRTAFVFVADEAGA